MPYSEEGPTAYEQNDIRAICLDGKVAMIQAAVGAANRADEAKINWGVAPLPLGPDAKGAGTLLITDSLAVFKGSGVEDKAIEFAKFITSPEVQEQYEGAGAAGLTPLRPSPAVDKLVAEKPFWKPFIDGIEFGGPEPLFTDYKGFQNAMIEMVQSVVTGEAEPKAALDKAVGRARAVQVDLPCAPRPAAPRGRPSRRQGGAPVGELALRDIVKKLRRDRGHQGRRRSTCARASSSSSSAPRAAASPRCCA